MGPEATIDLFQKIVKLTPAKQDKETVIDLHHTFPSIRRISLFATKGTYKAKLYPFFLKKMQIETLIPTQEEQGQIMEIIYGIKAGHEFNQFKKYP